MKGLPTLPDYPRVELDGSAVVIHYENGDIEVWGYEPNPKLAADIAEDIEVGLKAIDYVALVLMKYLSEIGEELAALDLPPEYVNEYLYEGYCKLSKWFSQLKVKQAPTAEDI